MRIKIKGHEFVDPKENLFISVITNRGLILLLLLDILKQPRSLKKSEAYSFWDQLLYTREIF